MKIKGPYILVSANGTAVGTTANPIVVTGD